MQSVIGRLSGAVDAALALGALEVAEVPAFAKGFCAQAACGAETSGAALRWAAGYVQREARKISQYQRWAGAA